jgi:hypothetical protein
VGGEIPYRNDEFCAVKTVSGWLATVKVSDYQPPTWPDAAVPKQMHLDLATSDLDAAEAEALRLRSAEGGQSASPRSLARPL